MGANTFVRISMIFMAFRYAMLAGLNQGVIAGVFTSGVAFTALLFWKVYNENLSLTKLGGMAIIILGVLCVGYQHSEAKIAWNKDLLIAIMFAMIVGLFLTTTAFINRYYPKTLGFTSTQLIVDSFMV